MPAKKPDTQLDTTDRFPRESYFKKKHPKTYDRVVAELAAGKGPYTVAKELEVDVSTVYRIREREQLSIQTTRERLAELWGMASEMGAERLVEVLADKENGLKAAQIPIAAAIAMDKWTQATGGVTHTIRHEKALSPEDIKNLIEQAAQTKQAEAIDVETEEP